MIKTEIRYEKSLGRLKCDICDTRFRENARIYKVNNDIGYVCQQCNDNFSKEDIYLIIDLFKSYGGYFGKFDDIKLSLDNILTEFYDRISADGNLKNTFEYNRKLCHKALLNGYTPKQLIQKMKVPKNYKLKKRTI